MTRNHFLWIFWIVATLVFCGIALTRLYVAGDRTAFLPGVTDGAHHQLEISCQTCHTADPFDSQKVVLKDMNKACVSCHKDELAASDDSHPKKKFTPPRMAAYWEKVDARNCTTCHSEHVPEVTHTSMVTLQEDFCIACHSEGEQDVRKNRPSHAGLEFDTCASAGCHNFHDNRALYEDFLVKHSDAPWLAESPVHPLDAMARSRAKLDAAEIEAYLTSYTAPEAAHDADIAHDWASSAHAAGDVSCAGCHAPDQETEADILANWIEAPGEDICASCHKAEYKTFATGRHGTRRHPKIAKPRSVKEGLKTLGIKKPSKELIAEVEAYMIDDPVPPSVMTTDEARVDLADTAHGRSLTCVTCHDPHAEDISFAAVDACLSCHDDDHSTAYKDSPHFAIWQGEQRGEQPVGAGVTCATCHMPKSERKGIVTTDHNQNTNLRPNEKMIRSTCLSCHSLEFSIDALADTALISNNFSGKPYRHIESIDWAVQRVEQPADGANQ